MEDCIVHRFYIDLLSATIIGHRTELRLPPTSTTTSIPYVPSTQKPRRKQQPQNNKNNIPEVTKAKDFYITNPFQVDNDLMAPALEGVYRNIVAINFGTITIVLFSIASSHATPLANGPGQQNEKYTNARPNSHAQDILD